MSYHNPKEAWESLGRVIDIRTLTRTQQKRLSWFFKCGMCAGFALASKNSPKQVQAWYDEIMDEFLKDSEEGNERSA